MNKKIDLLVIDPQFDFVDKNGALSVPGAKEDMQRLAFFIENNFTKFNNIRVSLDQHHLVHIANPIYWMDSNGDPPPFYTQITHKDALSGKWTTRNPVLQQDAVVYLEALEKTGKYTHTIWPPHCLIGSVGASIEDTLFNALLRWESQFEMVDMVSKGSNPHVEHFSIVKAEVEYPGDNGTKINTDFIADLSEADVVLVAGEALLHCVRSSFFDIVNGFKDPNTVKKLVFLKDCSSPVPLPNPGYQKMADDFYKEMEAKGVVVTTTDKYQF
jgi:nicotinamidase-related amidase